MFWNVLVVEQSKVIKRKILWVEMSILLAMALFVLAISFMVVDTPEKVLDVTWPGAPPLLLRQFTAMAGLFVVVLVASVVAQEYSWRTLHLMLSRGIPRSTLLAAKFGAVLLPVLLIVVAPLLVGIPITGLFTYWHDGSLDLTQLNYVGLVVGMLGGVYVLLPYAAGAFALAVLSRSTVTAIGAGVAFALVENIGLQLLHELGGLAAEVAQFSPAMLSGSILRGLTGETSQAISNTGQPLVYLDPVVAIAIVALYIGTFLIAAYAAFARQDITG